MIKEKTEKRGKNEGKKQVKMTLLFQSELQFGMAFTDKRNHRKKKKNLAYCGSSLRGIILIDHILSGFR